MAAEMSEQQRILSIRVDNQSAITAIQNYRTKIDEVRQSEKEWKKELDDGIITQKEYDERVTASTQVVNEYNQNIRVLNKEIRNNIKENEEQEGSLTQLRAQLSNLTKEYDQLGRKERETGEKGQKLRDAINSTTTEIKKAEEETQRYYRNVGNYENAILSALGANNKYVQSLQMIADVSKGGLSNALNVAKNAVAGFGRQLLALMANPIVAILAAIAAAVMLVAKAISSSEDNTNKWNAILAPFQRILNGVLNVIQNVVGAILSWVQAGGKLVGWMMTMMEKLPIIGNMLKGINDELRESIAIATADAELAKRRRNMTIQDAKDRREIDRLRKQAAQDSAKDRQAQADALKKIDDLEKGIAQRHVQYAIADYTNYKKKVEQTQSTADELDMLAQKEAAIYTAQGEYYQKTTKTARQLASAENALEKQYTATGNAGVDAAQRVEEAKRRELEAVRSAEDVLLQLIKDRRVQETERVRIEYERRIEDLKRTLATEKNLTVTARAAINAEIVATEKLLQQELDRLNDERLTADLQREQQRITLLLEATKDSYIKQRELKMQELEISEQLALEAAAKEIQDEEAMQEMLLAITLQYQQKRREVEAEYDRAANEAQIEAINNDYAQRIAAVRDNELAAAELLMQQKKELLEQAHQLEGESIEEWNARRLQLESDFLDAKAALADKEFSIEKAKYEAIASLIGGLSKVYEAFGEQNTALAQAAKVLALGEIAVNTGVAIAAGVKQAQSVPFPANITAVATTVATVLANIATAIKTVKSAKFAQGGYVQGAGTGTSDSIAARLSNGESVINANSTAMFSPLLSAFNQLGGGAPIIVGSPQQAIGEDMLAAAVAKGMQAAPRPVVSVEDINRVSGQVEVIERLASV